MAPRPKKKPAALHSASVKSASTKVLKRPAASNKKTKLPGDEMVIRPSSLPGAGLGCFAARALKSGHMLSVPYAFGGKRLTAAERTKIIRYNPVSEQAYMFNLLKPCGKVVAVDAKDTGKEDPCRFVNSCANLEQWKRVNLKMVQLRGEVRYVTTRRVGKDEELLIDYGIRYWFGKPYNEKMVKVNCQALKLEAQIASATPQRKRGLLTQLTAMRAESKRIEEEFERALSLVEPWGWSAFDATRDSLKS
eukprot:TRINITY_DN64847_c0_g1_i1.p1 TRINITY_DN64847_c0_g1~~TRINITY_DN64847_c0_g1_i1.p1  ORF type:complete len:269 (-),score=32.41 TRINITY_DN64847_c0_g1_i1:10-756(-)